MADEKGLIENIHLIDAPAGSGKTTRIRSMLFDILSNHPKDNILCITYTNRAAEELSKGIDVPNIFVGTIHSYIHSLISPFFSLPNVLNLYWEVYGEQIRERIVNVNANQSIEESNQRYIEKYGSLSEEIVRKNLTSLSYNETSFNSLYYGGLCHDDLISFAKKLIDRYPVIRKKIIEKYNFIFIDEYQDTSSAVLKLFYNAVKGTSVQMYLLGDRMQQIYKNYDGSFEYELRTLTEPEPLKTNYRSIKVIIDILNNIYNDPTHIQSVAPENKDKLPDYSPEVIITNHVSREVEKRKKEQQDLLILYLLNKDKFSEIGVSSLYNTYSRMDKYSYTRKYQAVHVLSDLTSENPDPLMRFLFLFDRMMGFFKEENFGRVIAFAKREHEFFVETTHSILKHEDKKTLLKLYNEVLEKYNSDQTQIGCFLSFLKEQKIIKEDFYAGLSSDEDYKNALNVPIIEVIKLANYLKNPQISTQHGVKGESHVSVLFVAADSKSIPIVHMYEFFRIWAQVDFSLREIEDFYYNYLSLVIDTEQKLGMHVKDLSSETHNNNETNKNILKAASIAMLDRFKNNKIFNLLCEPFYRTYLDNPTLTNAKACFKESTVYGCLTAYKLFYVGCSRARKNLSIVLDAQKIASFKDALSRKLFRIGFDVKEV